ncbi:MAG: acyl-CoA reductase [Myxococcales bacterium]
MRGNLGATVSFVPHGHGLGAVFVDKPALASFESAREVARGLALDVAAYDQRGCLSPLVAWVVNGANVGLEEFGELVFAELEALHATLPRGTLPLEIASAQVSWRGVGAMRGRLLEGDGFSVCCEERGALRLTPGYRNLQVLGLASAKDLPAKLAPLGVHLKTLGVAGVHDWDALLSNLPPRLAPRVCDVGSMQTPPLHALHDGLPPWEGLLRWAEC